MKIITLIENLVYQQGLYAEHGLSIYIESENHKILFDTGQSDLFLSNAKKIGINIAEIDTLVLSHGHYDHTGGLYPFIKINSKARVLAKRDVFKPKYKTNNRFIGTLPQDELLRDRIQFVDSMMEIATNVFLVPEIPVKDPSDTHYKGLFKKENDRLIQDDFTDELFLVLKSGNRINIITACSHRGITNICHTATDLFKLPVGLILGGFHLKNSSQGQFDQTMEYFKQLNPQSIGVCHCTGVERYAEMSGQCKAHLFYNYTGHEINL
jgi:7,8-dihydropterin-6-yl-methyl-4-(beta-D-ribofuranosyl)aminobenzene 5'-phosphate synthase